MEVLKVQPLQHLDTIVYFFKGNDSDRVNDQLNQVFDHPPSMEKLKRVFFEQYQQELSAFLIKHMPGERDLLGYKTSNNQSDLPDFDYEGIVRTINAEINSYYQFRDYSYNPMTAGLGGGGNAFSGLIRIKSLKKNITSQLEKLERNPLAAEHFLNLYHTINNSFFETDIEKLFDYQDIAPLLPSHFLQKWVAHEYIGTPSQRLDQIYEKQKRPPLLAGTNAPNPHALGEILGFRANEADQVQFSYVATRGDTLSGIANRCRTTTDMLLKANLWTMVNPANGTFEDSFGRQMQLQPGDHIHLPESYVPLIGELYQLYNPREDAYELVKAEKGTYQVAPFQAETFLDIVGYIREVTMDQIRDDNTRTYQMKLAVSMKLTGNVYAMFYIGISMGGVLSMQSGDDRAFGVTMKTQLGFHAGVGNQSVASAGVNVAGGKSMNPKHFNSLNGGYHSPNHFLAYFAKSIVHLLVDANSAEFLDVLKLGENFWAGKQSDEFWKELQKGYTHKQLTDYSLSGEAGVNNVASIEAGMAGGAVQKTKYQGIETPESQADKRKGWKNLLANEQEATEANETEREREYFVTVDLFDGLVTLDLTAQEIIFNGNRDNEGEYINISMTMAIPSNNDFVRSLAERGQKIDWIFSGTGTIEDKLNSIPDKIRDAFKDKVPAKTAVNMSASVYVRLEWQHIVQPVNDIKEWFLQYFRVSKGQEIKIGNDYGNASLMKEEEVFEVLGTNTISYISTVYNGIHKEVMAEMTKEEQDIIKGYISDAEKAALEDEKDRQRNAQINNPEEKTTPTKRPTTSDILRNHGNDPAVIKYSGLLRERAASQWENFKIKGNTDLNFLQVAFNPSPQTALGPLEKELYQTHYQEMILNFGKEIRDAVVAYAEKVGDYTKAKWSECKLRELNEEQARLYLGDIRRIVEVLHAKKIPNKKLEWEDVEGSISKFMYGVMAEKPKEMTSNFEQDILTPLFFENKVYENQVYVEKESN
ncbi:LysM domain-containing protein [Persicobacter diffluens]|uniref:LysM domain-containing protein n=2 Tax=Persicobacter diffluens TaxID=981 RepID=A0AAN5AMK2_9BACT|nr:hypothetical protein PEDI_50910 [Persicobacter diffluens]